MYEEIGVSASVMSASFVLTLNIEMNVNRSVSSVFVSMSVPKPIICRTACRSFVSRAMRSPMRWCWK